MKCFTDAFLVLLLAVVDLGILAPITQELKGKYMVLARPMKDLEPTKIPTPDPKPEIYVLKNHVNCCYPKYENFNCSRVKDYFITNIGCLHSVILFQTHEDSYICADAKDKNIQYCLVSLVVRLQALQALRRLEPLGLDRLLEFWHGS